jgi:hypothetical protein
MRKLWVVLFLLSCGKVATVKTDLPEVCYKEEKNTIARFTQDQIVQARRGNPPGRTDSDGDGIKNSEDNCPFVFNPGQEVCPYTGEPLACGTKPCTAPPPPPIDPGLDTTTKRLYCFFLDFDGQTVSTPYWNNGAEFYATESGLTASERQSIIDSIRKDYKNFPVTITRDSSIYFQYAPNYRQRQIFTQSQFYGAAGGVAYIGCIKWGLEVPCFTFTKNMAYNVSNIRWVGSHEFGHTANLYHQSICGTTFTEYNNNPGFPTAPIMGVSYGKIGLWWVGPNSFCNIQNDTSVMRIYLQ